jgi:hypothetical protein
VGAEEKVEGGGGQEKQKGTEGKENQRAVILGTRAGSLHLPPEGKQNF